MTSNPDVEHSKQAPSTQHALRALHNQVPETGKGGKKNRAQRIGAK